MKKRTKNAADKIRKGPFPLLAHLGMVAASKSDRPDSIAAYAEPYFSELKIKEVESVVRGIQMYLDHPFRAQQEEGERIWKSGTAAVRSLYPQQNGPQPGRAILLVPSLINSAAIFDLCEQRSMARFLRQSGHTVYLLDWGDTAKDPEPLDLCSVIENRLVPALRGVAAHAQKPVTIVGYCMGGTLSLAAACLSPAELDRLILLAAPWDFQAGRNLLSERVRGWAPLVLPQLGARGCLPSEWTQTVFATLDPGGSAKKFARFAEMDQDSDEAKLFVAVEDWLNEGIDLAPAVARDVLQQWFALNAPVRGEWRVGENTVDLAALGMPVLVVASDADRLVPFEAANAVAKCLPSGRAQTHRLACGHIGLIAGRGAVAEVWTHALRWLEG